MNRIEYDDLDKYFTEPKKLSPLYGDCRIPRKIKNKVKKFCGFHWDNLSNGQRLWYYLGYVNPNYTRFFIKKMCEK